MYTVGNFTSDFSNIKKERKKCFLKLILWRFFFNLRRNLWNFTKKKQW